MYNYDKLRGKIIEKYRTNGNFANALNISERTLSLKLNNQIDFKQTEILKIIKLLSLEIKDIQDYFFKLKVQDIETF